MASLFYDCLKSSLSRFEVTTQLQHQGILLTNKTPVKGALLPRPFDRMRLVCECTCELQGESRLPGNLGQDICLPVEIGLGLPAWVSDRMGPSQTWPWTWHYLERKADVKKFLPLEELRWRKLFWLPLESPLHPCVPEVLGFPRCVPSPPLSHCSCTV